MLGLARLHCGNRKCGLRPQATPSTFSCDFLRGIRCPVRNTMQVFMNLPFAPVGHPTTKTIPDIGRVRPICAVVKNRRPDAIPGLPEYRYPFDKVE
jgi:hypothetical protein